MRLGIITALAREAATFPRPLGEMLDGAAYMVVSAGPGQVLAAQAAATCLAAGCDVLMSWGLAGGLDPRLAPAALVVADAVIGATGETWVCDNDLHGHLVRRLTPLNVTTGRIASVAEPVAASAAKTHLGTILACDLVDMESAAVGRAAEAAGAGFAALRCIVDPAGFSLPGAALAGMGADGRLAPWATLGALGRRPGELPELLRLACWYRAALAALKRGARLLGA